MNKNITGLILLFFVTLNSFVNSQEKDTIFYNENWKKVGRPKASYFRIVIKKDFKYCVTDYFMTGDVQMIGCFSDKKMKIKEGIFYYYLEGNVLKSKISFKNNKYDGQSSWYYKNGLVASNEYYVNDSLKSYLYLNEDQSIDTISPRDQEAVFPGGNENINKFISMNVQYPQKAINKNQKERIFVKFIVEANGEVTNVKAEKCKYPLLGFEAERVIKLMPKWKNGKDHNVPCRTYLRIPINFKLT